jgi:uncharacterized protein
MNKRRIGLLAGMALAGVAVLCAPRAVSCQERAGQLQIPAPVGLVNDFAHVIPPGNAAHITQIASDVRTKSRGEMTVVTLPDIGLRAPADVALEIGRQWKVGKIGAPGDPTRNAGAVILLVPKETSSDGHGHCFIATGRGTEGFITDGDAGDICREATPYFQARDYGTGIELVTYRTAQRFADEFHFTIDTTVAATESPLGGNEAGGSGQPTSGMSPFALLFLLFVIFVLLSSLARRAGGPRGCLPIFLPLGGGWGGGGGGGWSGGGGGGGISFGGGGGFSGGGGGSSW